MIAIQRPAEPSILKGRGKNLRRALSGAHTRGRRSFSFLSSVYGHASVKSALEQAQHAKCCYCESRLTVVSYGDIEHVRPKSAARQTRAQRATSPGYYWLAYEWANLLLSCRRCNLSKSTIFPLANPAQRATSHRSSLAAEQVLLVDPAVVRSPELHVEFRKEVARGASREGRETIQVCDLNRPALSAARKQRYTVAALLWQVANGGGGQAAKASQRIAAWQADDAEYTSMIRHAVAANFR